MYKCKGCGKLSKTLGEHIRHKCYKSKKLKLKSWGCYEINKRGVWFYTDNNFKMFVPKNIIRKLGGMVI